jgi:hypothetical protein
MPDRFPLLLSEWLLSVISPCEDYRFLSVLVAIPRMLQSYPLEQPITCYSFVILLLIGSSPHGSPFQRGFLTPSSLLCLRPLSIRCFYMVLVHGLGNRPRGAFLRALSSIWTLIFALPRPVSGTFARTSKVLHPSLLYNSSPALLGVLPIKSGPSRDFATNSSR